MFFLAETSVGTIWGNPAILDTDKDMVKILETLNQSKIMNSKVKN
jgi:hypothetical protein